MDVVVCYKIVPDEQDIVIEENQTLSFDRANLKIGDYDLNAIEAGVRLADETFGTVTALSAGGANVENSKMRKSILSRGPRENFTVSDPALVNADSALTAGILKAALDKMGHFDVVLCGEGSADLYAQQVGIQLGALLGIPTVNSVTGIVPGKGSIIATRSLEDEVETLEIPLPAVISMAADANTPRIPSMRDILGAGKKPTTSWTVEDIGMEDLHNSVETLSTLAPRQHDRKRIIIDGDDDVKIHEFIDTIRPELQ